MEKIELLSPVGSLANLKAAVSKGADSVYLGMEKFGARMNARNFNKGFLDNAVKICKSNDVKLYLTMNTLVKNHELKDYFKQLEYAYIKGVDAVIIQETSFLKLIKEQFNDLRVHISTQAGVMNSRHANLLNNADRINLARELKKEEIKEIRKNFSKELEIFCHGALCVCVSGICLFSSLLGGRSGNRGRCAQPCRKKYNGEYHISTKEMNLIKEIPEIIELSVNSIKIEGRMRTPHYVANVTSVYREAIDSYYNGNFHVSKEMEKKLKNAFSREFTKGWFKNESVFNRNKGTGVKNVKELEEYKVKIKDIEIERREINFTLPDMGKKNGKKQLLVRVYNYEDGIDAYENGADIVYLDIMNKDFLKLKKKGRLFGVTPRIMFDKDFMKINEIIEENKPDGLLIGNYGMNLEKYKIPIHFDYNLNFFNDIDMNSVNGMPILSPELSFKEMGEFQNKDFGVMVHGKIRLMTMRNSLKEGWIKDERKGRFKINKVHNGVEILNEKEIGLLGKSAQLLNYGIKSFFVDSEVNVGKIVNLYRNILDDKRIDDSKLKKNYVLGWGFRGVE